MKDTKLSMVKGDTLAFGVEIEGLDQDLATSSFGSRTNQFSNMLYGVRGCTVHFPASTQTKIETMSGYPNFGGTNTTVLFDL